MYAWPSWLLEFSDSVSKDLGRIDVVRSALLPMMETGHQHFGVYSKDIEWAIEQKPQECTPEEYERALAVRLYYKGTSLRLHQQITASKSIVVAQQIQVMTETARLGSLVPFFATARAIIEQVAHYYEYVRKVQKNLTAYQNGVSDAGSKIHEQSIIMSYGTRIDWRMLVEGIDRDNFEQVKGSFNPKKGHIDHTAVQVLNSVDQLSKQDNVKGLRAVYEFLSEFAHPNIGSIYGLMSEAELIDDEHGFHWVRRRLSQDPPHAMLQEIKSAFEAVLTILANTLEFFQDIVQESSVREKAIIRINQNEIRKVKRLASRVIKPYVPCPCGSGEKFKFCCKKS